MQSSEEELAEILRWLTDRGYLVGSNSRFHSLTTPLEEETCPSLPTSSSIPPSPTSEGG